MPSILLMALGGVLAGGTWSLHKQGAHKLWVVVCGVLAVSALVAAWATTYTQ